MKKLKTQKNYQKLNRGFYHQKKNTLSEEEYNKNFNYLVIGSIFMH